MAAGSAKGSAPLLHGTATWGSATYGDDRSSGLPVASASKAGASPTCSGAHGQPGRRAGRVTKAGDGGERAEAARQERNRLTRPRHTRTRSWTCRPQRNRPTRRWSRSSSSASNKLEASSSSTICGSSRTTSSISRSPVYCPVAKGRKWAYRAFNEPFPDLVFDFADVIAEGDLVVGRGIDGDTKHGRLHGYPGERQRPGHRVPRTRLFRFVDGKLFSRAGSTST